MLRDICDYEILVIDGGSNDVTCEKIRGMASEKMNMGVIL